MRIGPTPDDVAVELDLIRTLRPLVRSELAYLLLREAVLGGGLTAQRLTERRRLDHNLQRVIDLLTREELIESSLDGFSATTKGRRLLAQVRRAADAGAAGELIGRRLILIRDAPTLDLSTLEETLGRGAEVLRSEGGFERIGVLVDNYAVANDLLRAVRQLGAKAEMTRVVEPVS
jgi:hypothetical protein